MASLLWRSPPETQTLPFTVKANVARLTITNDGMRVLDLRINGHRLDLDDFFEVGHGSASFDISSLIQYGANSMAIRALGQPDGAASLLVEAPAYNARILHTNDIHAKIDGLPRVAGYVQAARAEGGEVYFINAGDNFSGGPVSDLNRGIPSGGQS